ncbi:MAG: class I SAM-dependent methyltransferase [Syntrophomonadaceae bacterium]|nr:class I SAM-dependent methyltransferase [Syntrophomonadaceae bacterium]
MLKPSNGKPSYNSLLPIYPLLAQQCADDYRLDSGICLDIGTGNGYVGTEIAKITNMSIYFIDIEAEALDFARRTVAVADIDNEVFFLEADVCKGLPLADNFADFIISRGSIWFWEDKAKGLAEIYRVLKIGGTALIGGGFGRYVPDTMRARLSETRKNTLEKKGVKRLSLEEMEALALEAGIPSFKVMHDAPGDKGRWIEIHKHV